jgi:hypothetical protein
MLCADLVDVRWRDKGGQSKRLIANLEDISLSGACLQVDNAIPMGSLVRITYPKGEFSGVVRYCHFREIGYFVGIQFEPGCKWSSKDFRPLHLLDPRKLSKKVPPKQAGSSGNRASRAV